MEVPGGSKDGVKRARWMLASEEGRRGWLVVIWRGRGGGLGGGVVAETAERMRMTRRRGKTKGVRRQGVMLWGIVEDLGEI